MSMWETLHGWVEPHEKGKGIGIVPLLLIGVIIILVLKK